MEFVVVALLACVPALALLFVPRAALRAAAIAALVLVLFAGFWTWSFSQSCSSDSCIGVFFLGALTAVVALFCAIAGLIRWAMLGGADRKAPAQDFK